ncbi:hypothetical protein Rin_00000150 [Candidatus Regiella insecticola 5.15]|uniref:Uncharacterized protein n=1 Tax=Candidatus Regiella insecticola 5.15 TaxID=1005043 RepID=G2GW88_9ENTR|nr:hypothetical protein Rin_00000150 [Candidatus Regiella insecticola 5.15]
MTNRRIGQQFTANFAKSLFEIFLSDTQLKKKWAKKRSLHTVNEHFEPVFDEVSASTRDFEQGLTQHLVQQPFPQPSS